MLVPRRPNQNFLIDDDPEMADEPGSRNLLWTIIGLCKKTMEMTKGHI
jgi:hypothetical protein